MMSYGELEKIQRGIDGLSSPDLSCPASPCDFFKEPSAVQQPTAQCLDTPSVGEPRPTAAATDSASPAEAEQQTTPQQEAADAEAGAACKAEGGASENEEEFNIHALLKQSRRQKRQGQQQQQQQQQQSGAPSLPDADVALDKAAERVRQQQARKAAEAAQRAAENAGDDIQHVSASMQPTGPRRPAKKQQQVYVGLPVGVGWHVPLVGVEGRGGYKPSPQEQESKKQSPSEGQKRALTVKERERLKRKKGQSSHATWKPETWMQLRQQYD